MTKVTLAEQAFQTLKQALLDNTFAPGEKLSIAGLKARYNIGISPLREALARLVAMGLLESEQMKGFRVPAISMKQLADIYRARQLIDHEMLALAVENMTEEEEAQLVAVAHQLNKLEQCEMDKTSFCQWQQQHRVFIRAMMLGCHCATLMRMHDFLYDLTERYRRIWFDWSSERGHVAMGEHARDHQLYVDALVARDAPRLQKTYQAKLARWLGEVQACLHDKGYDG